MVVWYALIVNEASFGKCLRGLAARRFVPGRPWFIWLARTMVLSIIEWAHPSCMMLLWPRPSPIPSLHGRERSLARAPNRTRRIWVFYFLSTKKILLWAGRWWWSDLRLLTLKNLNCYQNSNQNSIHFRINFSSFFMTFSASFFASIFAWIFDEKGF